MFCNLSHKDREFYPTIIRGGRLTHNIRGGVTYMGHRVNLYRGLLPRVLFSICLAKASHAQLPDMPLRRDRARPLPYRAYSSYPAEGKASFS